MTHGHIFVSPPCPSQIDQRLLDVLTEPRVGLLQLPGTAQHVLRQKRTGKWEPSTKETRYDENPRCPVKL